MITAVSGAWAVNQTYTVTVKYNEVLQTLTIISPDPLVYENQSFTNNEFIVPKADIAGYLQNFCPAGQTIQSFTIANPSGGLTMTDDGLKIELSYENKFNDPVTILFVLTLDSGSGTGGGNSPTIGNAAVPFQIITLKVFVCHSYHANSSAHDTWPNYTKDANYHWLTCDEYGICEYSKTMTPEEWALAKNKAIDPDFWPQFGAHVNTDGNDVLCDVCGYEMPHTHVASTTYIDTGDKHYTPCTKTGCPYNSDALNATDFASMSDADKTALNYGDHVDEEPAGALDNKCDKCNHVMNSMVDPTHEHVPGNVWTWDSNHADYHYLPCSVDGCDITDYYAYHQNEGQASNFFSYEEHTYVNGICVKCNYDPNASPSAHVHTPAEAWVQKAGYHYHKCSVTGCDYNSEDLTAELFTNNSTLANALSYGVHVDSQEPIGLCDKCGYNLVVVHAHDFESTVVYGKNDNYHWLICQAQNCPLDYEAIAAYTSADNSAEVESIKYDVAWAEHDYTSGLLDNTCICGKLNPAHTHVPSDSWTKKDTYHYKKCTVTGCTLNSDNLTKAELEALNGDTQALLEYGSHVDDNPADGLCDQCGYQITQGHTHTLDPNWVWKDEYHYHMCTEMGCPFHNENLTENDFADVDDQETFRFGEHEYGSLGEQYYTCKICGFENQERKAQKHTEHKYQWAQLPTGNSDANGFEHWQQCINQTGYCDALFIYPDESEKKHKFNDEATDETYYICSICGYVDIDRRDSETRPHAHEFSTKWTWTEDTQNEVGVHYHKCISNQGTCPLKYDGFDNEALEVYGHHEYGTSQEGTAYYICKTCGYESEVRKSQPHTHQYGDWVYNSDDHWKVCSATEGACAAPRGFNGPHSYYATDDASTPDIDERAQCSTCPFYNQARANAIKNAASAAKVQSWSWDYEIPFNFEAPVLNDRRMNAEQCYTIFLPYALELNGLKGYALEQHNDYIIGFKEQAVPKLPQLIPFVVKPEKTGNPLNSTTTTIYMTLQKEDQADWMTEDEKQALISDRGYANSQPSIHSTGGRLYMLGSLKYLTGNAAGGRYIMQGKDAEHPNGVFKMIDGSADAGYDKVDNRSCILPMRAHIETLGGDSREFLGVRLIKADGSVTTIDRLVINAEDNTVYDLQGRRVENPRKGGLYIIGGKKTILK